MLFNQKLDEALCNIVEDITSRMQHLTAQINKILKVGPNSPIHKYAKRSGIEPDPEQVIMSLAEYDPTEKEGLYMPWIIKMVGQGLNLPEDGQSLYSALEKFHRIKRSPAYKGPKDIMQVRSLPELTKHVDIGESKTRAKANVSGWERYIETFLDTEYYKVIRFDPRPYVGKEVEVVATGQRKEKVEDIKGESAEDRARREERAEDNAQAVNWILREDATPEQLQWAEEKNNKRRNTWASKYTAKVNPAAVPMMEISVKAGTVWCLASPEHAMSYFEKGPVYFFYKKDEGGMQLFSAADNYFDFSDNAGGWVDIHNNKVMKLSSRYAMLLCKMILLGDRGESEQLHPTALKHIGALLKRLVRQARAKQLPPEWYKERQFEKGVVDGKIQYTGETISPAALLMAGFEITQRA